MNKYRVLPKDIKSSSVRFRSIKREMEKYSIKTALDADGPNLFALKLGIMASLDRTIDLNRKWDFKKQYDTITSFEVIEHLQNPLLYLECIYNHLTPGGRVILTTPVKWMFKGRYHFHEFTKDELIFCLSEAKFTNIQITRISAYNLRHFGIRPIIRKIRDLLFGQCFFVVATKIKK